MFSNDVSKYDYAARVLLATTHYTIDFRQFFAAAAAIVDADVDLEGDAKRMQPTCIIEFT